MQKNALEELHLFIECYDLISLGTENNAVHAKCTLREQNKADEWQQVGCTRLVSDCKSENPVTIAYKFAQVQHLRFEVQDEPT